MYKVTNRQFKNWDSERRGKPLIRLEDEHGGQSVIAKDDHCFVLYNGSNDRDFVMVRHWYKEAAIALASFIYANPEYIEHWGTN